MADDIVRARTYMFPDRDVGRTHRSVAARIITFANALGPDVEAVWPLDTPEKVVDAIARVVGRRSRQRGAGGGPVNTWIHFFRGAVRNGSLPVQRGEVGRLNHASVVRRVQDLQRCKPEVYRCPESWVAKTQRNRSLTETELMRLLACANAAERAFLLLLASTALRSEAMTLLRVDQVTHANGEVREDAVVIEKNSRYRRIPLVRVVREAIATWLQCDPRAAEGTSRRLFPVSTPRLLQRMVRKAGLSTRHNPHQFRTYLVEHALRAGSDVEDVARYLGHRSGVTTLRYYGGSDASLRPPDVDTLIAEEVARVIALRLGFVGAGVTKGGQVVSNLKGMRDEIATTNTESFFTG